MRRTILKSIAAAGLAMGMSLTISPAQASTVKLDNYAFTPASSVSVTTAGYSGGAGEFVGHLDGNAFSTFCVDLFQYFSFGSTYTDYTLVDGNTAFGAARETLLGQLFTYVTTNNLITSADRSAAVQSAVWEIIYETTATSPHSFSTGNFQVTGTGSGATTAALGLIDWNAIASGPDLFNVALLASPNEQDFIVITPRVLRADLPEPSVYALLLAALLSAGMFLRRRSR